MPFSIEPPFLQSFWIFAFVKFEFVNVQDKMTNTFNKIPQTPDEANTLMEQAIEVGDFEAAKEYYHRSEILKNYREEVNLAGTVHNYYVTQQKLSTNMNENFNSYKKQIEEARIKSDKFFQNEYRNLKRKQETELDERLDKWDKDRNSTFNTHEHDYNQTMITARLVAQQKKFDEAIKIRTLAEENLRKKSQERSKEIDAQYRRQCDLLLERQQQEINALAGRRQAELRIFDALSEAAESEALDSYLVNNASAVIGIAKRFQHDSFIPKALSMQTVRSRKLTIKPSHKNLPPERTYLKKMDNIDKALSSPLRQVPGKESSQRFSPSRTLFSKNEDEINESFSLTRSPVLSPYTRK